jgi:quinolinate synthase
MIRYAAQSAAREFVVATEVGILHRLHKKAPGKRFIPVRKDAICHYMKRVTLEKVYESLRDLKYVITVPEEIAVPARRAWEAMLALG